jgi:hypothetical protein
VQLADRDEHASRSIIVVSVVCLVGLDEGVDCARDCLTGTAGLVLVDHGGPLTVVPHPGHQVAQACTAGCRQVVPGVAQVVKVKALGADGPRGVRRAADLGDEPAFRERAEQISRRHTDALTETVAELADLGLVGSASAEVRTHGGTPTFKLYILNGSEAFFGFYPLTEHTVALHGQAVPMYDLMGKDVTTFHYEKGDDPADIGGQFVEQAQAWFDSMWATISRPNAAP